MVATVALITAFVVIGLSVVLVAMGGGPKKARQNLAQSQSRGATRTWSILIAAVSLGFGIAIPGVVMAVNADDKAASAPGGVDLNASEENGRKVFAELCSTCHTLNASNAVGRVGPNLDQLRPPKELTLDALKLGRARGLGQMPAGLVDGEDAEDVANYVTAVAGRE